MEEMQSKLNNQVTESEQFKLPMQLTMKDIEIYRNKKDTVLDGKKNFVGHHDQVKQIVLDALTTEADWGNALDKINTEVIKIFGKEIRISHYDNDKKWNRCRIYSEYDLCLKVKTNSVIIFSPRNA